MTHRFRHRPPVVPIAYQDGLLRYRFSTFRKVHLKAGSGEWKGTLQPRLTSPSYIVMINYRVGGIPSVKVIEPKLRPDAPHKFKDGSLCLYWMEDWVWTTDRILAETLIPWTALWLLYYELWMDTEKWLGPEAPHEIAA